MQQNARGKAEEVLAREQLQPGELVLGVDTVVVSDGEILGKARDEDEATRFVRRLAARRHEVYSGLYLTSRKMALASHAVTGVTFRSLTDGELAAYIGSGEWRERAGAYAIQGIGSALVQRVDGDYFNVVGPAGRRAPAPARRASASRPSPGSSPGPHGFFAARARVRPPGGELPSARPRRRRHRRACPPVAMPRGTVYNRRSRFASKGARHQLPRIRNGLWRP